jgi:hypothetical protein
MKSKPKFRVGQIVVGNLSDAYVDKVVAVLKRGGIFVYRTADGNEWEANHLRQPNRKELGR